MAAAASLTIPVSIATPAQAFDAQRVLYNAPGASHVAIDAAAGKVTFKFEFPGNIDRVMEKLRARHVSDAAWLTVSVPVENITGRVIDGPGLVAHLNVSPVVQTSAYDGKTVTATVAAQTNALRYLYEEIIIAGLMPLDVRTIAYPWEFLL